MIIIISIIVITITYVSGEITKAFISVVSNKYVPIQNVIIGFISGILCFCIRLYENIIYTIIVCLMSSLSAGGIYDLVKTKIVANRDRKTN